MKWDHINVECMFGGHNSTHVCRHAWVTARVFDIDRGNKENREKVEGDRRHNSSVPHSKSKPSLPLLLSNKDTHNPFSQTHILTPPSLCVCSKGLLPPVLKLSPTYYSPLPGFSATHKLFPPWCYIRESPIQVRAPPTEEWLRSLYLYPLFSLSFLFIYFLPCPLLGLFDSYSPSSSFRFSQIIFILALLFVSNYCSHHVVRQV